MLKSQQSSTNPTKTNSDVSEQFPTQIYVGGLNADISESDLRDYFEAFGQVIDVFVPCNSINKKPRGFAYITFQKFFEIHPCDEKIVHKINDCYVHVDRNDFSPLSKEKTTVLMLNGTIQSTPTSAIRDHFSKYGNIVDIIRKMDGKNKFHRYAFIQFDSSNAVDQAIVNHEHHFIDGETVFVRKAKSFECKRISIKDDDQLLLKYRISPLNNVVTLEVVKEFFQRHGQVVDSYIPREYGTDSKKTYGYVIISISKLNSSYFHYEFHTIKNQEVRIELDVQSKNSPKTKCVVVSASPSIISRISEEDFKSFFNKFGEVVDVRKPLDRITKRTTHYAFVDFKSEKSVERVIGESIII